MVSPISSLKLQSSEQVGSGQFSSAPGSLAGTQDWRVDAIAPKKVRTPAWTDRVLWRSSGSLHQLFYGRSEISFSEHKPVSAAFIFTVRNSKMHMLVGLWSHMVIDFFLAIVLEVKFCTQYNIFGSEECDVFHCNDRTLNRKTMPMGMWGRSHQINPA